MKNLFILLTLVIPISLLSQNWQPINPDFVYYFKSDTSQLIDNTVKVTSVSNEQGYPVLYLNTVISHCDSCDLNTFYCMFVPNDELYHRLYPNFLMKEIHILNSGKVWFRDTSSFVIMPDAHVNQPWLFDTVNSVTAEITQVSSLEVFPGVMDSIKTISLSDGNEILLSKNHGILEFPAHDSIVQYFQLEGLKSENMHIGNTPPSFHDYFDFEVGDVFQFYASAGDGSFPPPNSDTYIVKVSITSMEQNENYVKYGRHVIKKSTFFGGLDVWDDIIQFDNAPETFVNHDPNTLYYYCNDSIAQEVCWTFFDDVYSVCQLKSFSLTPELTSISNYINNDDGNLFGICFNDSTFIGKGVDYERCKMSFTDGLGLTEYSLEYFEHWNESYITGYVKDGDTVGIITPDELLLNVDDFRADHHIKIFPNPANEVVWIETDIPVGEEFFFEVLDMSGRLVCEIRGVNQSNGNSIVRWDLTNQSGNQVQPGIYFCKITVEDYQVMEKIVVIE